MEWPVAFSIVGTASAVCVAAVKMFPCKMAPLCKDLFLRSDKRIDEAVGVAWKEIDASRQDRSGIRENIREVEKTAIELETEVAGIHKEIKEIKDDVRSILDKVSTLTFAIAKRNEDGFNYRERNS